MKRVISLVLVFALCLSLCACGKGKAVKEAEAAIVVDNAPYGFGCIGCARTNELSIFLLRNKGIPVLELTYPTNQDETYVMVNKINDFVDSLEQTTEEGE